MVAERSLEQLPPSGAIPPEIRARISATPGLSPQGRLIVDCLFEAYPQPVSRAELLATSGLGVTPSTLFSYVSKAKAILNNNSGARIVNTQPAPRLGAQYTIILTGIPQSPQPERTPQLNPAWRPTQRKFLQDFFARLIDRKPTNNLPRDPVVLIDTYRPRAADTSDIIGGLPVGQFNQHFIDNLLNFHDQAWDELEQDDWEWKSNHPLVDVCALLRSRGLDRHLTRTALDNHFHPRAAKPTRLQPRSKPVPSQPPTNKDVSPQPRLFFRTPTDIMRDRQDVLSEQDRYFERRRQQLLERRRDDIARLILRTWRCLGSLDQLPHNPYQLLQKFSEEKDLTLIIQGQDPHQFAASFIIDSIRYYGQLDPRQLPRSGGLSSSIYNDLESVRKRLSPSQIEAAIV